MESTVSRALEAGRLGREVIRKPVWLRKKKGKRLTEAIAVVYCATPDGQCSGLVTFESLTTGSMIVVRLSDIEDITLPECLDERDTLPGKKSRFGYSRLLPPSSDVVSGMWLISLAARDSKVFVFAVESPEDQRQWYNRLKLFTLYPFSPIPLEPELNPATNVPGTKLNPAMFNADSVWYVHVLPEEVGSRVSATGVHVLALSGQTSRDHVGQIEIFAATKECRLRFVWDRRSIVEGGCLGNLAFVRIGEQGRGGPGLLWLYPGVDKAATFYQTLCRFIEEGDAREHGAV